MYVSLLITSGAKVCAMNSNLSWSCINFTTHLLLCLGKHAGHAQIRVYLIDGDGVRKINFIWCPISFDVTCHYFWSYLACEIVLGNFSFWLQFLVISSLLSYFTLLFLVVWYNSPSYIYRPIFIGFVLERQEFELRSHVLYTT